ncbi:MAG: ABC transporter ATP-binding protein [Candidatus Hydrogenedentes bacterium]|nr:ABC transporter ATP-binding protein [Candidatus Hydrogenedentota bacterium]
MDALLEVKDLEVTISLKEGAVRAVNGVSFRIPANRTLGVVGESGCGKSMTARALLRILPPGGRIVGGQIRLAPRDGHSTGVVDIAALPPRSRALRAIRGGEIAMIFQEPMTSLSPVHSIGDQIGEGVRLHRKTSKREARERAVEMLRLVGVPMPERRVDAYPHQLSGGLRQRSMIAIALACRPRLLIADEPTTALDVTIQAQILNLIERLQREMAMSVMMITHDLGVIAETADEVAVMYLGRIVEYAPVRDLFDSPMHPYTQGLLASIPRIGRPSGRTLYSIPGTVPDPYTMPPGCPFHPRCPQRIAGVCDRGEPPAPVEAGPNHQVACRLYESRQGEADDA